MHDFAVQILGGADGKGDDEELLAGEGGDEGGLVVVVDGDGFNAGGERGIGLAFGAADGGHAVLAGGKQGGGEGAADSTGGLGGVRYGLWVLKGCCLHR